MEKILLSELQSRLNRFRKSMDKADPDWERAVFFSKINIFYFTGTMQEGFLYIPRDNDPVLFVRRSYERALDESNFPIIMPMNSFSDAVPVLGKVSGTVYTELEFLPIAMYQRFHKYFPYDEVKSLDAVISKVRSVKSQYELDLMKRAGSIHKHVLENVVPDLLKEGMSEADLAGQLYQAMLKEGHQGLVRFGMLDTHIGIGQLGFGESSLYPTSFNGPGGNYGMSPAVPFVGSRQRLLKKGDLVFVDAACGFDGYHTDKTMTYMFGCPIPEEAIDIHKRCVEIQFKIAEMLKPGAIPSEIYQRIMDSLSDEFKENFMGYGKRTVKFLGHGIGLVIDEYPVIARGFNEPLEEGMVLAVEPKKGVKGVGMVGPENTFLVTVKGGISITGESNGLILVDL